MGKGSGGTRASSSGSPRGLSASQQDAENSIIMEGRAMEKEARDAIENRIEEIVEYARSFIIDDAAGRIINNKLKRAIDEYEINAKDIANSLTEQTALYGAQEMRKRLGRIIQQVGDNSVERANADDATGRRKQTYTKAAERLDSVSFALDSIGNNDKNFGNLYQALRQIRRGDKG